MRIWLNVKFSEKDEAKRLGAQWSPGHRRWYVEDPLSLDGLMRWIPDDLKREARAVTGVIDLADRPPAGNSIEARIARGECRMGGTKKKRRR